MAVFEIGSACNGLVVAVSVRHKGGNSENPNETAWEPEVSGIRGRMKFATAVSQTLHDYDLLEPSDSSETIFSGNGDLHFGGKHRRFRHLPSLAETDINDVCLSCQSRFSPNTAAKIASAPSQYVPPTTSSIMGPSIKCEICLANAPTVLPLPTPPGPMEILVIGGGGF